ncbi:MAG: hypothetical protein IJG08_03500 [Oscillospiraceae bacterium]|nr:hypothetical protein [Oscillospiraceae bacterium]MBR7055590.1 hypothetical protein [Oscillospiraceae bacterium]
MEKFVSHGRLAFMALVTAALIAVSLMSLYKLQIVEGQAYYEESRNNIVTTQRVSAARGNILDRYGRVLVENRVINDLVIDEGDLFRDDDPDYVRANATILRLCTLATEFGDEYIDTLPITKSPPFEYTPMSDWQRVFLEAYLRDKELSPGTTAVELMAFMRDRYKIDNSYTAEETRTIAGIRYEINGRYSRDFNTSDYVFAKDVSMDLITTLMENAVGGFDVRTGFTREVKTEAAGHLLGYTGQIFGEEVEKYTALGYDLDAYVGKSGAELAFESWLHGTDGQARVTRTATGVVTDTVYTKETIPGNHIYLTIDIGMQQATERVLDEYITEENQRRAENNANVARYGGSPSDIEQLITGGAAVAVDVNTGEPLAIASWPTYSITELLTDYESLNQRENSPLFNRAFGAAYAPGSTFKPCTAIAGLAERKIFTGTVIRDEGVYTKYEDIGYAPVCWIYSSVHLTHGDMNVSSALTNSCNYFFYAVGDALQISLMAKYAKGFGLGEPTGIELAEEIGAMTSDQYMQAKYGRDVYAGETIQAAIGQAESMFTPLQLAEYCAALANNGTRHSASILKSVYSYDFSQALYQREPEVLSEVKTDQAYYDAVHYGMHGVVTDPAVGAAFKYFQDAPYSVAGKTGTAQVGEGRTNTGVFICYAPYYNPQVAVAVVVEKAGSGASVIEISRSILDYYFSLRSFTLSLEREGSLLR